MSFVDTLKRSLGFEESSVQRDAAISDFADEFLDETYTITPEQPFYEIILIRPRTLEDMDYILIKLFKKIIPSL